MRTADETVSWLIFLQREDFSTTFTDSFYCSILSKATQLLSSRRVLVKPQLLKNPLKLLPVATRQTFPYKYTFPTDSNASLWLFSSVNHETFLEIYLAKIKNIFAASNHLLTKISQKMFSEAFKHTYNYQEKMAQVFQPRSISRALSRTHPERTDVRWRQNQNFSDITGLPNLPTYGAPRAPL